MQKYEKIFLVKKSPKIEYPAIVMSVNDVVLSNLKQRYYL